MIYQSLLAFLIVLSGPTLCAAANAGQRLNGPRSLFCPEAGKNGAAAPGEPAETRPDPCTDLMRAAENGNARAVRALLSKGADVNAKMSPGITALMLAAKEGHLEVLKLLVDAGADVNAMFAKHHVGVVTTLTYALGSHKKEVAEVLIDAGAEVNPAGITGLTPLMYAIGEDSDPDLIKTLLHKGADVNLRNRSGATAVMLAAMVGTPEVVRMLIEAGADVNAETREGVTALSVAIQEKRDEIVRLLKQAGAKR